MPSVHGGGGGVEGICLYHGIPPVSLSVSLLILVVLVGGRVDLLGAWGSQTRAFSVGGKSMELLRTNFSDSSGCFSGPIFAS